jgi:hypothetical protein
MVLEPHPRDCVWLVGYPSLIGKVRFARHSGALGGIHSGFPSRLVTCVEFPLGLGFDQGETLAVAISAEPT